MVSLSSQSVSDKTARLGIVLACVSAATFGFGTTFAFLAYEGGSNPLTVVLARTALFVPAVGFLLAYLGRLKLPSRGALVGSVWMAATLAMVSLGYQGSVAFVQVSVAALIFYSFPLMVALIAVASGRDRMTIGKGATLLAAFVGLSLALGPGFATLDWRGVALALLAALGMALSITFGGVAIRGEDAMLMSVYTNLWMLAALVPVVTVLNTTAFPVTPLAVLGAVCLCLTYLVAYLCWYFALGAVRPVRLAGLSNIEPLVTLFAAWVVLGETLSGVQFIGAALVLASILLLGRPSLS